MITGTAICFGTLDPATGKRHPARNVVGRGCGIAAVISAMLHFVFEPTVIPNASVLASAVVIGIMPLALGNLFGTRGFGAATATSWPSWRTPHRCAARSSWPPLESAVLLGICSSERSLS